jgi:hypothetical protein
MDARAFLISNSRPPAISEWLFAAAKLALGIALTWLIVPLIPLEFPLLRGWIGMTGLIFVLHFGSFHLLSCAWRAAGVDAKPLMNWPIFSASLSEFWGRRWNTAFRDLTFRFLFRPLASRIGPRCGLAVGFLISGLVHDLVISVPAGDGYGWPTLYFAIQGLGLLFERSRLGKALGYGSAFTALVVIGPAYGLFHPPFVRNVILPFLDALGAT